MLFLLYISVFLIASSQACDCPDLSLPTDVPIDELRIEIFQKLHNRPNYPISGWSDDALLVRSIAYDYIDESEYWKKTFGEQFTLWMTLFQYRYENYKPSACDITQYLNGVARCIEHECAKGLLKSSLVDLYYYAANYFYDDGLASAGCGNMIPLLPHWKCPKKDLKYDIDTIWNDNTVLPKKLKKAVNRLYHSNNHTDKFLAALATFAITPGSSVTDKLNEMDFLELVNAYNVVIGPSDCCDKVEKRLEYLSNQYLDGVLAVLENQWKGYKKPNACVKP